MKTTKSVIAILIIVMTIVSCFSLTASAKNVCSEISGRAAEKGGNAMSFTVKTNTKGTVKVKMNMKKGRLGVGETGGSFLSVKPHNIYGYYEILVYVDGKVKNKVNVKNSSSYTISLSGSYNYEIRIYNWRTSTIASYRGGFVNRVTKYDESNYAIWEIIPTWKIAKTKGISYCY